MEPLEIFNAKYRRKKIINIKVVISMKNVIMKLLICLNMNYLMKMKIMFM